MKAVQINSLGGDNLEVNDVSKPVINDDQILIEVYAASINPIDWKIRTGYMKEYGWLDQLKFPVTLGGDFAGKISEVGKEVSSFKKGDEVYGYAITLGAGSGSFAEFAAVNAINAAPKPKSIDFLKAASLPLAGVSALQALENHAKLKAGQKVLIHGGAGGIGSHAIQIVKLLGAYVATTVSKDDKEYVKSLGADEAIDYKNEKFEEKLKDFDVVFDNAGGETTDKSFKILKRGGILISMTGEPNEELATKYEVNVVGQNTEVTVERLNRLTELVDSGKVKPQVDKAFPLEQVKEAFSYQEKGSPRGKVVLKIKT